MTDSKAIAIKRGDFLAKQLIKQGLKLPDVAAKISRAMGRTISRSAINNKTVGMRGIHLDEVPFFAKIIRLPPSVLAWHFDAIEEFKANYDPFEDFLSHKYDIDNVFTLVMKDRVLEPEIKENDKLLIQRGLPELTEKTLLLIRGENSGYWVRYIKPELSGGYTLYCYDKENYPDQVLENLDNINIIGKVVSVTRWQ
jgi:hypothetical protein